MTMKKAWLILALAACCEIAMALYLKLASDWNPYWIRLGLLGALFNTFSASGLTVAGGKIDMSVAYTCWSATAGVGIAIVGVWVFGEPIHPLKMAAILMTVSGIAGIVITETKNK